MTVKVKLMTSRRLPMTSPGQSLGSAKPVSAESEICETFCSLFKAGVTGEGRDWLQPGNYPARAIFFLTVRRMSQCIIICPSCEREILSDDQVRRTSRGQVVCEQCARDTYLDVPLA